MLSKAELEHFLTLLLAFATATGLSAANSSKVLGTSHQSMCRWLKLARDGEAAQAQATVYRYLADPLIRKLERLKHLDETRGLYTAIEHEKPTGKVATLRSALDGRAV